MMISVVIPSYHRPDRLIECLEAVKNQLHLPDEVIVVCRSTDPASISSVRRWKSQSRVELQLLLVEQPGQIAALRTGLAAVTGDVVVFTDDDTVPAPDWIHRLVEYYVDPSIGGVGGRDVIDGVTSQRPTARRVGVLTWYGKLIGNHHLGCRTAQDVDVLKGANASFRTTLVSFPEFFRGSGAEVHNEVFVCLRIRKMGYRLIYDPEIRVDHFPAPRFDVDQRDTSVPQAIRNASFNFTVTTLMFLPLPKLLTRFVFSVLVGHKGAPGLLRWLLAIFRHEEAVVSEFVPTQIGQIEGVLYRLREKRRSKRDSRAVPL